MKKNIIILILLIFSNLSAQTPIKSLFHDKYAQIENAYYKDVDLDFDNFIGTWKFTDGNTIFEIKLQKVVMRYDSVLKIYEDFIIGEYRYVLNGVQIINTISNLNTPFDDSYLHNIVGTAIIKSMSAPICPECSTNERRVSLMFNDPIRNAPGLGGRITLRRIDENGVQKIQLFLQQTGSVIYLDETPVTYTRFHVPWGSYVLVKQP